MLQGTDIYITWFGEPYRGDKTLSINKEYFQDSTLDLNSKILIKAVCKNLTPIITNHNLVCHNIGL